MARDELHAVDVLVKGKLDEAVRLEPAAQRIAHAGAHEEELAAGIVGLGLVAAVARLVERIELQQQAELVAHLVPSTEVERQAVAGTVFLVRIAWHLPHSLHQPPKLSPPQILSSIPTPSPPT